MMPCLLRVQVLGVLALSCVVSSTLGAALARGVPPEKQEAFAAAGKSAPINCAGAAGNVVQLQAEALNDDFCDCADGSDEPGTGACAGQEATMFYCPNEGGTPQVLYASRVDDGVCDCCDGSDEAGLAARRPERPRCENRCVEQGERERAERAAKMEKLKVGLEKKTEAVARLAQSKPTWEAELAEFEAKTKELDASLATAKAAAEEAKKEEEAAKKKKEAEAAEKEGSTGGGGIRSEVEALRKTVVQQQQQIELLQEAVVALKAKGKTGGTAAEGGGSSEPAVGEEKKQVSEYAKWMEGAGETPGAIKDQEESDSTPDEGGDEEDRGDEEEEAVSSSSSAKGGGADAEVRKVEQSIRENKKAMEVLKKKIKLFTGDESRTGYASLDGECLELHDGQYKWSVCFDGEAKQDQVPLGRNFEWQGAREAHFTEGQMCPGGPARMLRVIFECGGESKIMDIIEPSRCVYEARISNPGACDAEDAEKLERPPVKHPKDEL